MNEKTITESTLLFLARGQARHGLRIRVYTMQEEPQNGADWAWCFMQGGSAVAMRVQAKRLYGGGRYKQLKPSGGQINRLINQAGTHHPYYVFYNDGLQGVRWLRASATSSRHCGSFKGDEHWGCMIARAQDVKRVGSNAMTDLLPVSMPWHCMLCPHRVSSWIVVGGVSGPSLPDIVAANLTAAKHVATDGNDRMSVEPTSPPDWVQLIRREMFSRMKSAEELDDDFAEQNPELEAYLEEYDLSGVALFTQADHDHERQK